MVSIASILMIIVIAMLFTKTKVLKEQVSKLEKKLSTLTQEKEYNSLSNAYISPELRYKLCNMKETGDDLKAIKLLKENTTFDLVMAKKYIEHL